MRRLCKEGEQRKGENVEEMEVERKWENIKGINISGRGSGSMHGSMREKWKRGVVVVVVEHGKPRRTFFWGERSERK